MMLNNLLEGLVFSDGQLVELNGFKTEESEFDGSSYLASFCLDHGLPVWTFEVEGLTIEKRVYLPHRQNTTFINYRVTEGSGSVKLQLRPAINFRGHEAPVNTPLAPYEVTFHDHRFEIKTGDERPLRMIHLGEGAYFSIEKREIRDIFYEIERSRGYTWRGDLWSPGYFCAELAPGCEVSLVVSTEKWEIMSALTPQQAWDAECDRKRRLTLEAHPETCGDLCRDLVWAADQFIFVPVGRQEDTARARAVGDEIRSVIAGYHWFTDWGRDTMISLEGLTLTTGRQVEASYILRTFAH
jgi:predicted glycogen debranching enzyme